MPAQKYSAWFGIAYPANSKAFESRFCIFQHHVLFIFRDEQQQKPLDCHAIVHAEILDRVNRGMCLVDENNQTLWLHTTNTGDNGFETWFYRFRIAILLNPKAPHHQETTSEQQDMSIGSYFKVRRIYFRNFLCGRKRSMFVVLRDSILTGFRTNVPGKSADLYGRVKAYRMDLNVLEILLENGHLVQLHPTNGCHAIDPAWLASLMSRSLSSISSSSSSASTSQSQMTSRALSAPLLSSLSHPITRFQTSQTPPPLCCVAKTRE